MATPVQVGQIVGGKYEVERVIAQGGIGLVVKARHVQLHEACAIKFLLPEALEAPMARERFLREARACARLRSDHVVKVFDVGELDEQTPYIVLEYLEGVDLEGHMQGGPLPPGEAALYCLQVCAALAEAHALGIVHRDIKPGNVFLARREDGTTCVKLLDFGISKLLGESAGSDQAQTMEGTVMGTPSAMAPEQARGDAVDTRTDIWAVGVLLYHLLTGAFPFDDPAPFRTLDKILRDDPGPPSGHVPTVPRGLDAIVLRCLEKDPARRPANVDEVATALAPFVDEAERPLSLHVRRVFESLGDGRASLPAAMMGDPERVPQTPPITSGDLEGVPQTPPITSGDPERVPQTPPITSGDLEGVPQTPPITSGDLEGVPQTPPITTGDPEGVPTPPPVTMAETFEPGPPDLPMVPSGSEHPPPIAVLASERPSAFTPDSLERPTSTPAAVTSLRAPRPPRSPWPAVVAAVGIFIAAAAGVALAPRSSPPARVPLAAVPMPSAPDPEVPAPAASPVKPAPAPVPAASASASATPVSKPPRTPAPPPPRPPSGSEGFDLGNRR